MGYVKQLLSLDLLVWELEGTEVGAEIQVRSVNTAPVLGTVEAAGQVSGVGGAGLGQRLRLLLDDDHAGAGIVFADASYHKKYGPKLRACLIGEKAALVLIFPAPSTPFTP